MIRRVREWVRHVIGRSRPENLEVQQHQELIEEMTAKAKAEYREQRLKADLERLLLIEEARRKARHDS